MDFRSCVIDFEGHMESPRQKRILIGCVAVKGDFKFLLNCFINLGRLKLTKHDADHKAG